MGNGVIAAHGAANGTGTAAKPALLDRLALPIVVVVLLVVPFTLSDFRLSLLAKYLCFAFPAIGIVLIWGYGGILSLGQGIFFGLGSYMMAMFLKLESTESGSSAQALSEFFGSNLPDFMVWNSVEKLPWWWEPFHSIWFTLGAIFVIPAVVAFVLAYANFRKRVGGVYFSIITLALSAIMAIMIVGQQGVTGGINGITDFKTVLGFSLEAEGIRTKLYLMTVVLLLIALVVSGFIVRSRLGKVLVAIRDREDRVRFSGYDTALFKAFIFTVAAVFSSIGGAFYSLQVGLITPGSVGIVPSVEMVIYAAVGGRLSLLGAVYGAVLVVSPKPSSRKNFLQYWLYFIGSLFVFVVMFLPEGLAGLVQRIANLRGAASSAVPRSQPVTLPGSGTESGK